MSKIMLKLIIQSVLFHFLKEVSGNKDHNQIRIVVVVSYMEIIELVDKQNKIKVSIKDNKLLIFYIQTNF